MLSDRLISEMGMLKLQVKESSTSPNPHQGLEPDRTQTAAVNVPPQAINAVTTDDSMEVVKLDKDEFRLLAKMLHAIGHECTYDHICCDGHSVTYQHPKMALVFNDITLPDTNQIMNLSSLKDLVMNPALKRAVWEKLKTLK